MRDSEKSMIEVYSRMSAGCWGPQPLQKTSQLRIVLGFCEALYDIGNEVRLAEALRHRRKWQGHC